MLTKSGRATLAATAAGLLTITVGGAASAAPTPESATLMARRMAGTCQSVALATLGYGATRLTGGDPTGRYLVGYETPYGNADMPVHRYVMWVDQIPRQIDTTSLPDSGILSLNDVNRHGTVVGTRQTGGIHAYTDAFTYRDGRYTLLPALNEADHTAATAINARGDIVGYNRNDAGYQAVLWPADRPGTVRALTVSGHTGNTFAVDIDEDGTVLGHLHSVPGETPYIWPPGGTPYQLTGPTGTSWVAARAVRNGWVVGGATSGDRSVTLRWNLRRGTADLIEGNHGGLLVNRHGTIAGVGVVLHRDGRVVSIGEFTMPVVITDGGSVAAPLDGYFAPAVFTGC